MADKPIPQSTDVIELAEWRVRKEQRSYFSRDDEGKCQHYHLTMDKHGFTVKCDDCRMQLSAYWVLERMLDTYRREIEKLESERKRHQEKVRSEIRLTAAREVERAWRSRRMVPSCPHCSRGIFAADGFGGSMVSKELEFAHRKREPGKRWGARPVEVLKLYEEAQECAGDE